jgi:hypothetical protein
VILKYFSFQFLGELSLIDADPYLKYLPSLIAGAAFHLALYTVTGQSWVCTTIAFTLASLKCYCQVKLNCPIELMVVWMFSFGETLQIYMYNILGHITCCRESSKRIKVNIKEME